MLNFSDQEKLWRWRIRTGVDAVARSEHTPVSQHVLLVADNIFKKTRY
jgi:hypothetical protein